MINLYSVMIAFSLFAGMLFVFLFLRKKGISFEICSGFIAMNLFIIIYCAKMYTIIVSKDTSLTFLKAGLSSLGGAVGLLISMFVFGRIFQTNRTDIYESVALSLPLMYGISKLACHFAGCCYGIEYFGIFHRYSIYDETNSPLFPVQMVETVCFLMIFVISIVLYFQRRKLDYLSFEMIICGIVKFGLDFLRISHSGQILSINQIVCVIFVLIGVLRLYIHNFVLSHS